MKKQFILFVVVACLAAVFFNSCQKEQVQANDTAKTQFTIDESNYYTPTLSDFEVDMNSRAYWTTIPAGSTDVLQDAIDNAEPGGIIYLKSGMHRENDRVTVNKRVTIIGENGAMLMVSSVDTGSTVDPALHVLDAPGTLIKNIELLPMDSAGWVGIMLEGSPGSGVLSNKVSRFVLGVLVQYSDRVAIIDNYIIDSGNNGINSMNGKSVYIADNLIEGSLYSGIWANDMWGTAERNICNNNGGGILLCKVPEIFGFKTPDGSPLFAANSCIGWKVNSNTFSNTPAYDGGDGLTVTDGAHWNMVTNNEYFGNAGYDVHLKPDIDYGFLFVPASHNNSINEATSVIIKDCGNNNTITGGTMVDTSVDPC